ncbi:Xaa-Pro dipeptidase [Marinobacter zhejiangensis]|uniref:Xaa-Pro dipeptidase n=1 Tax=Marinobacter zhejiangensis TaxID=488535 RepID=A0A1I4MBT0_9GAMM|nr:Xaa-Pro dipeptidase [Marinobacter zhejiangensis]SFM00648.1 Xaa-Pro dipeptidase [Marinobacter zhejiangensis]
MPEPDLEQLQRQHIETLQQRYSKALVETGYDALLISSGAAPMRYADDHGYPFQGYGPFLHWTGLTGLENSWLLIQPGQGARLQVHTPDDFWHASAALPDEAWARDLAVEGSVETAPPLPVLSTQLAVLGDPLTLAGVPGDHNPPALVTAVEATRIHKTEYEIACLAEANSRAAEGHRAARAAFLAGESEFGISLAYQQATQQRESEAPYHSIIGLNDHAGILHYQFYDVVAPEVSRSLLIDAGYRYRGYGSDITRTWAGPGQGEFQALLVGLEALQKRLCQAVAPGVDFVALHRKTHLGLAALLSSAGVVKGMDEEAMVAEGITRAFFPHGLGHLLGVQVHDVGGKPVPSPADAPFLRLTRTLEPGMVVTIEPGLYFIPSLLAPVLAGPLRHHLNQGLIDILSGCGGIRIEDNVVVTAEGGHNLTRACLP